MAGGGTAGGGTQAFASSLTDLMTSLAVIFILLLVVFLKQTHDQTRKAKDELKEQLQALLEQKSLALKQDPEDPLMLAVAVGENQLRFPVGGYGLSEQGTGFVDHFFRNFAEKICSGSLREKIDSIIVEGHTDRSGEKTPSGIGKNINLSQRRSYTVLERGLKSVQKNPAIYECLLKLASASGRGSSNPVMVNNEYNADQSRRVEIKIRVRSAEQVFKKLAADAGLNVKAVDTAPAKPPVQSQQLAPPAAAPKAQPVSAPARNPLAPPKDE